MCKVAITIFTEFGFSFSPLFIYQELNVGEKKDGRQGCFHSLTKIIRRKGGFFWIPDQVRNDELHGNDKLRRNDKKIKGFKFKICF